MRFVEDDWESPTLGAWGLGWQVWLDGLEISQFTYFQQVGGIDCRPVSGELTYGLERIAMYLQDVDTHLRRRVRRRASRYGEICKRAEWEWSTYNFEEADVRRALRRVRPLRGGGQAPPRARRDDPLKTLVLPAYDFVVKAAHQFNVLDARGAIGVTERARFIGRVRGARARPSPRRTSRSARRSASRSSPKSREGRGAPSNAERSPMCTLVVAAHVFAGHPLVVVANRDEQLDRASSPPSLWASAAAARSSRRATTSPAARGSA